LRKTLAKTKKTKTSTRTKQQKNRTCAKNFQTFENFDGKFFFDLRDDHEQKMNLLLLFTLFTLLYMLTKIFLSKSI